MLVSPLRYPGGKAKLYKFFTELLRHNNHLNSEYSEPYAGGAGLALRLLSAGYVQKIFLNDIDPAIYAFWKSALERTDDFCRLVRETPVTVDEWRRQRETYTRCDTHNPLELGFSAYFLNRTSRSGIIEGSGPIGGYSQAGPWKIDVRLVKDRQVENLEALSRFASQILVSNLDAIDFIKLRVRAESGFMYLDPPYYVKGSKLYKNFYEHDDHRAISDLLNEFRDATWIVSYDDVPQIREIYERFDPITYSLQYSAGQKASGKEVVFLSDALEMPDFRGFGLAA